MSQATTRDITPADTTRVFSRGDATGSFFFRIPFLAYTQAGTLIAGTDANRGTTGDSADNIDAAIRRKPNAIGKTAYEGWEDAFVPTPLNLADYVNTLGYKQSSSSVIDGCICSDARNGKLILLIDLWAWNGGVIEAMKVSDELEGLGGRIREVAHGSGCVTIDTETYLLLSSSNITEHVPGDPGEVNRNTDLGLFDHVVRLPIPPNGLAPIHELNGRLPDGPLSVGQATTFALNEDFVLHRDGIALLTTPRGGTTDVAQVPLRVWYQDSPLQVYNTGHIVQVTSDDDGITWRTDRLITPQVKPDDASYYLMGPGAGCQLTRGEHAGRILAPIYFKRAGDVQRTSVIYTDDTGVTWHLGGAVPSEGLSEAALVETPDGHVQVFARHCAPSGGKIMTALSTDAGETWTQAWSALGDDDEGVNCQVSAVRLASQVVSPTSGQPLDAFALTSARSSTRVGGEIHIGLWHDAPTPGEPRRIEWLSPYPLTSPDAKFGYSCMTQVGDQLVVEYESSPTDRWPDGLQQIYLAQVPIATLISNVPPR